MTRSTISKRRRWRKRGKSAPIEPKIMGRTGFLTGQILAPENFDRMGAATIEGDFAEVFKESRGAVDPDLKLGF